MFSMCQIHQRHDDKSACIDKASFRTKHNRVGQRKADLKITSEFCKEEISNAKHKSILHTE